MAELYHVGISRADVARVAVVVDRDVLPDVGSLPGWAPLRDRREYVTGTVDGVVVCGGSYGSAASALALEELTRGGAHVVVGVARCCCEACRDGRRHAPVVPVAAVRGEHMTADYAPPQFPAVADHAVRVLLRDAVDGAVSGLVHTHDLEPEGPTAAGVIAEDLWSAAFYVVGAAQGAQVATVVVPAASTVQSSTALVATVVRAVSPLLTEAHPRGAPA